MSCPSVTVSVSSAAGQSLNVHVGQKIKQLHVASI